MELEVFKEKLKQVRPALEVVEYINRRHVILQCQYGHIWETTVDHALSPVRKDFGGCPYCSNKILDKEKYSLGVIKPEVIEYFVDKKEAFEYSIRSRKQVKIKCPYCGAEEITTPELLYIRKDICKNCISDGLSRPNKILRGLLNQLKDQVDNYSFEYNIDNTIFRYDGFFEKDNKKYLIEMHGGQHYKSLKNFDKSEEIFKKRQQYDKEKICLAEKENYTLIIINCSTNFFEDIKKNILNSELKNIFKLSELDWRKILVASSTNYAQQAIDKFNSGEKIEQICSELGMNRTTIRKYLKEGNSEKLCNYEGKTSQEIHSKKIKLTDCKTKKETIYNSMHELIREVAKKYNINISMRSVRNYCNKYYIAHGVRREILEYKKLFILDWYNN